jgi:hypothetical protein
VLLDFGASIPILNRSWAHHHTISTYRRAEPRLIENFSRKIEPEIALAYPYPVRIQHRKHFSVESFEIGPTNDECDPILPFWWIAKHAPANLLGEPHEVRFEQCLNCTETSSNEFNIRYDSDMVDHPEAMVIGLISTSDEKVDPNSLVPAKFRQWADIMIKEAAQWLRERKLYNHVIDVKDRETPPWGPFYVLSEKELEVLRDWLKEMLETSKIQQSKSPAGSPI